MVVEVVFHSILPPVRSAVFLVRPSTAAIATAAFGRSSSLLLCLRFRSALLRTPPGAIRSLASMSPESPLVHDVCASVVTAGVALGLLRFWEELAKRGVFEQVCALPLSLFLDAILVGYLIHRNLFKLGI